MTTTIRMPQIGISVIYHEGDPTDGSDPDMFTGTNGTREHPAIVTRIISPRVVNLHVMLDMQPTAIVVENVEELEHLSNIVTRGATVSTTGPAGWYWPPG